LNKEININVQNEDFNNAFKTASEKEHKKIIQTLLNNEINVNAQSKHFNNAFQIASERKHEKIV